MALAETAELAIKLTLGGNFLSQMSKVNRSLKTLDKDASRAFKAGQQIGTGIKRGLAIAAGAAGLLATQVALGLDSLVKLEKATAQTNAVIKSTGGIAGVTAEEVRNLSEKYEALNATIGDELIQSGQNLLLTFTAISEDAFEPALKAALDLSVALNKDLDSAIRIVGKALSDPAKAMAQLRRQGIILTAQEEKQIKAHLKNNDALSAQNVILAALDKRYEGSFLAGGQTTAGKVAKFTDAVEDLQRSLAVALLPAVSNIADALTELLADEDVIKATEDLGREIGKLFSKQNIKEGARVLGQVFDTLRSAAPAIKSALGTVGTVLKSAFDAFTSLPPEIQQLLVGGFAVNKLTGGLVTNIAGGIFGALKAMTVQAGVVNVTGGVVNGGGAAGAAGTAGAIGVGTVIAAASILAIGYAVGSAVVDGLGGPLTRAEQGTGRVVGQLAGVNITLGRSEAALVRAAAAQERLPASIAALRDQANRTKDDTVAATNKVESQQAETKRETARGLGVLDASQKRTRDAALETKRETARGAALVGTRVTAGASSVVSAIYANRPIITTIVNVSATTVKKTYTVAERYGPNGGSRDNDRSDE